MEGLIIPLIIIILSSLFGRKKPDEKPAPKPAPRNIQTAPQQKPVEQNPFKSLGDLAKEFQQEQQQARPERKQTPRKQAPRQVVQAEVPPVIQKAGREAGRDQGVPRSTGRLSVHQVIPTNATKKSVVHNIMPDTKEELMRAIVLSEILAPPKSKR
ncbi:hypothetical protein [Psychrobacillus sp. BL-248-WT-3]|uniref:hypothetical protein n=1 Tax=Psychrobacillus sp. BL-248-WT-3 TaxID=2725306 RepID=UPI00146DEC82|nr:hypothetical protein [Psychrobacillus sp. BL-248-WT-3]NME04295.1 hypothetical protein [Psychrobacillus sp. BL-248-WT-3]